MISSDNESSQSIYQRTTQGDRPFGSLAADTGFNQGFMIGDYGFSLVNRLQGQNELDQSFHPYSVDLNLHHPSLDPGERTKALATEPSSLNKAGPTCFVRGPVSKEKRLAGCSAQTQTQV